MKAAVRRRSPNRHPARRSSCGPRCRLARETPSPWTAAAMKAVSLTQPNSWPASMRRENRGSSGSAAIWWPSSVGLAAASRRAEIVEQVVRRGRGLLRRGRLASGTPASSLTPEVLSSNAASDSSMRWTSGASNSARRAWSAWLHKRKAASGAVRPARPARCSAAAREIFLISRVLMRGAARTRRSGRGRNQ